MVKASNIRATVKSCPVLLQTKCFDAPKMLKISGASLLWGKRWIDLPSDPESAEDYACQYIARRSDIGRNPRQRGRITWMYGPLRSVFLVNCLDWCERLPAWQKTHTAPAPGEFPFIPLAPGERGAVRASNSSQAAGLLRRPPRDTLVSDAATEDGGAEGI
jgi:hypothetical protein